MLKWISFGLYALVGLFYYYIWSDVPSDAILAYAAARDTIILGIFVALALTAILMYVWGDCNRGEEKPYTHVSSWFFYTSILLGVYNFTRFPAFGSVKDGILKGYSWSDVPLTGFLAGLQSTALIFGIILIAVEFLLYHRRKK